MYNAAGRHLEPAILQLGLHQAVSFPTHLRTDGSFGSLLDLLLVSSLGLSLVCRPCLRLGVRIKLFFNAA